MMNNERRSFNDYVWNGMDAFLRFTAGAGNSIRVASNTAVERIDLSRIERRLERLNAKLGALAYKAFADGRSLDARDIDIARIMDDIAKTQCEIDRRKAMHPLSAEKNGKNENGY